MNEFIEHLHEVLAGFGPISVRRMFGGHGIYHQGLMFALVSDQSLYLKADAENSRAFIDLALPPFQYHKNGKVHRVSYYLAPEAIFEEPELAAEWARRAFAAALRAKSGRKSE